MAIVGRGVKIFAAVAFLGLGAIFVLAPQQSTNRPPLGTPAPPFKLFVTVGLAGAQITNDGDGTWDSCEITTVAGSYTANIPLLRPHQTVHLAFDVFSASGRTIPDGEGYLRIKSGVSVSCAGSDYDRHKASFTF